MFISRPSDPRTVLLWGDRWWIAGMGEPVAFDGLAQAAEVLAAHFADEPKPVRLRLVYQPDALVSVAVACPNGDRKTLAAALAEEFPALGSGNHAWGHEPVLANADGHTTVLHFETEPELIGFATRLAQLGLAVDSAWPLVTVLHALPEEWTDSGAITVVALQARRAIAYRHPKDGGRTVRSWQGDSTIVQVGQWLGGIFAENADEPVLVVSADDETVASLESYVGEARSHLEWLRLSDALGRRIVLPRYHPAQLLPRELAVTAQRAVLAASIALLLGASGVGFVIGRDWLTARAEAASREARLTALRAEVAHLRENAAEIAALRSLIEGGSAGPPCGALLQKLSTTVPSELVLSSVQMAGRNIAITGWVAASAPPSVLDEWRDRLAPPDAPWAIAVQSGVSGAFTATGTFRP